MQIPHAPAQHGGRCQWRPPPLVLLAAGVRPEGEEAEGRSRDAAPAGAGGEEMAERGRVRCVVGRLPE